MRRPLNRLLTAAVYTFELEALTAGTERVVAVPLVLWVRAGSGRSTARTLHTARADPHGGRVRLDYVTLAQTLGVVCPRAADARQQVLQLTTHAAELTVTTDPVLTARHLRLV